MTALLSGRISLFQDLQISMNQIEYRVPYRKVFRAFQKKT